MRKRVFYKVMAYVLLLTLLFPALGGTHAAHAAEVQDDVLFLVSEEELAEEKVLILTEEEADENGNIVIAGGAWERVIVRRCSQEVKKIYLQGIEAEMLILEGGMNSEITISDSYINEMYVMAPQTGGISFAEFDELIKGGVTVADYIPLLFTYYEVMRETTELHPTVITKGATEVHDVHVLTNAVFMLYNGAVEKVAIETKDTYSSMHVDIQGYNGVVSVDQNRAESEGTSYLGLKIKDCSLQSLEVKGESGSCHVDGDDATIAAMKVSGTYGVVTSVDTKEIVLDETAENASVRVYSEVEKIDVQGDNNRVILSASAEVEHLIVAGDNAKVYGWGDLNTAEVLGENANVAVPGADVTGEHDSTIPDEMYDMLQTPSKPSTPSTPSKPSTPSTPEEPDEPVVTPEPTPDEEEPEEPEAPHVHTWETEEANCVTAKVCGNCGFVAESATGAHTFGQSGVVTAPSCEEYGYTTYTCKYCDATDIGEIVEPTGHSVSKWEAGTAVAGKTCEYTQQGTCATCGETIVSETTVTKHNTNLKVTITTEATCQVTGVKTFSCPDCSEVLDTQNFTNAEAHTWVKGTEADGKIPYTCACGATKYEVSMSASGVSGEVLDASTEVKLESAVVIALDTATINQVATKEEEGSGETVATNVKLTAETLDATAKEEAVATLTEEEKEQLGDSDIYDFSMLVDDEPVTEFDGSITVRIPYELEEGEDPEAIIVWYIADNGTIEKIDTGVTYSAGYVTFTTTHFSYYSVVKMSAAERCAAYGHIWVNFETAPTCKAAGHTTSICQRCGESKTVAGAAATGHNMASEVTQEASCGQNGITRHYCTKCTYEYTTTVAMKAHTLTEGTTVAATCLEPGYTKYTCTCGYEKNEVIPATGHVEGSDGKCSNCGVVLKCEHYDTKCTATLVAGATGCEDGVIMRLVCIDCGEVVDEWETTGHDTAEKERISLETYAPGCNSYISVMECACGESGIWYSVGFGNFDNWEINEEYLDSDHYTGEYTYADSGLRIVETWEYTQIEGCEYHYVMDMEVYLDDVLKATYGTDTDTMRHWYGNRFELAEGATSCEEGIYCIMFCINCGVEEKSDWLIYEHMPNVVVVDLSEYTNTCGGEITTVICPCGAVCEGVEFNIPCWISVEDTYYTDTDGHVHEVRNYACENCELTFTSDELVTSMEGCWETREGKYTIYVAGTLVETVSYTEESEHHDVETTVRLVEGATSCEEGVEIAYECKNCEWQREPYVDYYHKIQTKALIDMSEYADACGTTFVYESCVCGEDQYFQIDEFCNFSYEWSTYTDEDNVEHFLETIFCNNCATSYTWDLVSVDGEECAVIEKNVYCIYYDGKLIDEIEYVNYTERHDFYTASATLREGSVTCEDGVDYVSICRECGYVYDGCCYYHIRALVDAIDLSEYGVTCGGYIEMYECACGAEEYGEIEFCCNTGTDWDDMIWGNFELVEETSTSSIGREEHVCADCGTVYTMENRWALTDSCNGQSDIYFCIGEDGNYEVEVRVSGYGTTNHTENKKTTDTTENGIKIRTTTTTCANCDEYTKIEKCADYANDDSYGWVISVEYIYTDSWDKTEWEYTFDSTDGCSYVRIETDSDGYYHSEEVDDACWSRVLTTDPTCTQYGKGTCDACGCVSTLEAFSPNGHSFTANEEGSGYTCSTCGLESESDSNDGIVLEDLSDDDNYVAGYWNNSGYLFSLYVSVNYYTITPTINEEEIFSSGIVTVSKSEIETLAAEQGITGDLEVCFSFVNESQGICSEIYFK